MSLRLSGAGEWDISGQYTRQKVDLRAAFTNTTFTPILAFVPSLSDLAPALQGSLTLRRGRQLRSAHRQPQRSKLVGNIAGIGVQLPSLRGSLGSDGLLTAQTSVQASGGVSGSGNFSLAGQLSGSQLSNTLARYQGSLSADVLGALGSIDAQLRQGSAAWTVQAQARQGGTLSLSGQVSPDFNLKLAARSYNLPIRTIYARESSLNGDLTAITSGEQIVVGGSLNFARLVLGRLGAAPLPVTPETPGSTSTPNGDTASFGQPVARRTHRVPECQRRETRQSAAAAYRAARHPHSRSRQYPRRRKPGPGRTQRQPDALGQRGRSPAQRRGARGAR